ncbi:MAG: NF038122 family metalloprotease [Cyanobacteria bacterium P01_D01_bin.156]
MNFIKRMSSCWTVPALASSFCLVVQAPSQALQFNFSYEEGTPYEQMLGFKVAGDWWSSYITDDVTVNIHVGTSNNLPKNVVGSALPGMHAFDYFGSYRYRLEQDVSSDLDQSAVSVGLPGHRNAQGGGYYKGQLEGATKNAHRISLTKANAKAVGLPGSNSTGLDGMIMMSDLNNSRYRWNYDFDRSGNIDNKSVDFLSVAVHEIGHVLGFVSSFDTVTAKDSDLTSSEIKERLNRTTPLDLFRRSSESAEGNVAELRAGKSSYLSADNGTTRMANFARGNRDIGNGSDGYQASHWRHRSSGYTGIMGPAIQTGSRFSIKSLDLKAMDIIGWDLNTSTARNPNDKNLSLLEQQAKESLAQELGKSISWLNNNKSKAASLLADSDADLLADITADSDEYYQLFGASTLGSGGWWQLFKDLGYAGWWQEYVANDAYGQKAYFSTLEAPVEAKDVPEPTTFLGLLGLTAFSLLGQHAVKRSH